MIISYSLHELEKHFMFNLNRFCLQGNKKKMFYEIEYSKTMGITACSINHYFIDSDR